MQISPFQLNLPQQGVGLLDPSVVAGIAGHQPVVNPFATAGQQAAVPQQLVQNPLTGQVEVSKSCVGSSISGGAIPRTLLRRAQADRFIDLVVDQSNFLQAIRTEKTDKCKGEINRLDMSAIVVEGASSTPCPTLGEVYDSSIPYDVEKYRAALDIYADWLECNLQGQSARNLILSQLSKQIANNMDFAAFMSDTNIPVGPGQSKVNNLLGVNDGFLKMAKCNLPACQIIDANGAAPSKDLFFDAIRRVPERYSGIRSEYRFIMNQTLDDYWMYAKSNRATASGDAALYNGERGGFFGVDNFIANLLPSNLDITLPNDSVVKTGTFMLLSPLKNLVWMAHREITLESERIPRCDKEELTVHFKGDFMMEEPEQVVLITNIDPCNGAPYCGPNCCVTECLV